MVDLKRFVPGEDLQPGLLTVAEQIPVEVVSADVTSVLRQGYWPSFNVPYFQKVYNDSGYPDFVSKLERFGQHFSKVRKSTVGLIFVVLCCTRHCFSMEAGLFHIERIKENLVMIN